MGLIKTLKFLYKSEHPHFISVDKKTYFRWKLLIRIAVGMNKNYKSCEIFRRKYKVMEDFVVVGLKYNGKNVKRRTSGYAKEFLVDNREAKCLYCEMKLHKGNATADHIIPISEGGNNTQVNLIVCCKDCNNERGNTEFKTYLSMKNKKYKNKKVIYI
jgi:5-methylcytosine-specific restriction endonuclease McrA